ncbi:lipid II flippase MurJ [Actinomadura sp. 6N118]|uniref:lipid II flippase MurJ n=1 Tax=Actinomadura sp. 6N118 TaxID=3375151 RepID=UPI003797050D
MVTPPAHRLGRASSIGWAAGISAVLICCGTALGFVRDLTMAHLFGASSSTDAFLVAWTVPETMSPLLIEDAMALIMVPAVARRLQHPDGARPLIAAALPRLAAGLALAMLAAILGASLLVEVLAPGLHDPGPAVLCVRLTAVTILTFGVAGFMSATLRAHHCFGPPASIYLAYNLGILTVIAAGASSFGITSAAAGVAWGSVLMVAIQLPAFLRELRNPPQPAPTGPAEPAPAGLAQPATARSAEPASNGSAELASAGLTEPASIGSAEPASIRSAEPVSAGLTEPACTDLGDPDPVGPDEGAATRSAELISGPVEAVPARSAVPVPAPAPAAALAWAAVIPVVVFTLTRQAQTLAERFIGSSLAAGSISHLNYAQKVAQVPMVLSLLVVTVTFPRLARDSAGGDTRQVRSRVEADLVIASAIVLAATAYLIGSAQVIIQLLFEHGRFTAADTTRTATLLQIYSLGLWGQATLGVCARAYFAQSQPGWRPAAAVALGPAVTIVLGVALTAATGAAALAAANAIGITLAAAPLLAGLRTGRIRISLRVVAGDIAKLGVAAVCAGAAATATTAVLAPHSAAIPLLVTNLAVVCAVFVAVLALAGTTWSPLGNLRALRSLRSD